MPALPLTGVRPAAAAALAPVADTDPVVLMGPVDAATPPAIMLVWDDPWVTMSTVAGGRGLFQAQLQAICLAGRFEPTPGFATLEDLVVYTISRLQADPAQSWPLVSAQAPREIDIGGITLLGVRLTFQIPVSMNGGT